MNKSSYSLVIPLWRLEPNVEMISPSPEKHLYHVIHMLKYFRIGDDFLGHTWIHLPNMRPFPPNHGLVWRMGWDSVELLNEGCNHNSF